MKTLLTEAQIQALNDHQNNVGRQWFEHRHPLTCGGDRCDADHDAYQAEHGGDWGQLVATAERWECPVPGCEYTQEYGRETGLIWDVLKLRGELA